MYRTIALAERMQEVFLDGLWIANTNYQAQLLQVDLGQALQKVGSLNSIAALTFHINYYLEGLLPVFNGEALRISDHYSFDLQELKSEAEWQQLVQRLLDHAERFIQQVREMPEEQLDQPFAEPKYGTYLRNIEGVIEHSYYHLGQITLIRKLLRVQ